MGSYELMELEMQYVQKELDDIIQVLILQINNALDTGNKEAFMTLSKEYNELQEGD